ncbi:hypothetical protein ARMSODRAFT_976542 [Armillaria solidipes]|uniref:Uncharacterized protein n=1 Tax=Armillaria solidipes TaxID=1076256 RepID=A0A2H3BA77_9AGAR|nr:hypothetical protein ARMSODRAFT_976542 [Armillaria solidipes]
MTSPPGVEPVSVNIVLDDGNPGRHKMAHIDLCRQSLRFLSHWFDESRRRKTEQSHTEDNAYVVFIFEKRREKTVPSTLYLHTPRSGRRGIMRVGTGIGNELATIHVHLYATILDNGRYQNKKQGRGPALGSENMGYEQAKSANREWTIRSKGHAYAIMEETAKRGSRTKYFMPCPAQHIIDILPLGPAGVFSSPVTEVPHQAGPSTITHAGAREGTASRLLQSTAGEKDKVVAVGGKKDMAQPLLCARNLRSKRSVQLASTVTILVGFEPGPDHLAVVSLQDRERAC